MLIYVVFQKTATLQFAYQSHLIDILIIVQPIKNARAL